MTVRPKRRFDLFRLLLIVIPCLFFLPELIGLSRFAGWDITRLNLPLKWYDVQSIRDGVMPLWNHYLYAGMPQLAESESGLFYPGNILLHLPGDFFYWANLTYILHFVLAGLFMDLWLRGRGIRREISFFGAILFQFAPFLLFHISSMAILQSIVWFPLLLWLADRFVETSDNYRLRLYGGFIFLFGGMLMLIGSAQMAFYQGFFLTWYLLGHSLSDRDHRVSRILRGISLLAALAFGAILIGAVIWIPAREFAEGTIRGAPGTSFYFLGSNWLLPQRLASAFYFPAYGRPTEMVGWASSLIYVGLLPTLLVLARLLGIRVNWSKDAPFIVMGAVALFLAIGMYNPLNHLLIKIPPFEFFRYMGRYSIGVIVAMIGLAANFLSARFPADGEQAEFTPPFNRKLVAWLLTIAFLGLLAFILTTFRSKAVLVGGIILLIDIAITWWACVLINRSPSNKRFQAWIAVYLLFHLVIVFPVGRLATMRTENFRSSLEFFDLIKREDGQPARLLVTDVGRFADRDLLAFNMWGPQTHLPNICAGNTSVFAGVQSMDPYTPMMPVEWYRIIREQIEPAFKDAGEINNGILPNEASEFLYNLGIDAIVTSGRVVEIPDYILNEVDIGDYFTSDARLFTSTKVRPRAWFLPHPDVFEVPGDENYSLSTRHTGEINYGMMIDYGPNSLSLEFAAREQGWLIVEASRNANWSITLDGNPTQSMQANEVFQAIPILTPEYHTCEFKYKINNTGFIVSGAGLAGIIIWFILIFALKPRRSC